MPDRTKTSLGGAAALALLASLGAAVHAAPPDQTPYSHALGDLRAAKWSLKHQSGDPAATAQEAAAVKEIDKAIGEVTQVVSGHGAKGDADMHTGEGAVGEGPGTDMAMAPPAAGARPDVHLDYASRLRNAEEALRKARADIDASRPDPATKAEHDRIASHIDSALQSVQQVGAH